jgi:hypothetical protein
VFLGGGVAGGRGANRRGGVGAGASRAEEGNFVFFYGMVSSLIGVVKRMICVKILLLHSKHESKKLMFGDFYLSIGVDIQVLYLCDSLINVQI